MTGNHEGHKHRYHFQVRVGLAPWESYYFVCRECKSGFDIGIPFFWGSK